MKTITLDGIEYQLMPIATEAPKPVQWEPKRVERNENYFAISLSGFVTECSDTHDGYDAPRASFGNYFYTKQEAEEASKQVRQLLRLRAYVREFAPGWEADWNDPNQEKWFIYIDHHAEEWNAGWNYLSESLYVYMPKEVSIELVRKLNSGEVVL